MKLVFSFLLFLQSCQVCLADKTITGGVYNLVLVGGGLDDNNKPIWNTIINLGGGKGVAKFGVIAAASGDPCCGIESSWVFYNKILTYYGAAEVVYIPITVDSKEQNSDPKTIELIRSCTGFFFSGGDQSRVIYSFYNQDEKVPSPALLAIKETLIATGGVAAGTSAGTDCLTSNIMVSCGDSYQALKSGTYVFWKSVYLPACDKLSAYGPGGIGLFPFGLVDTHFANRGRQGRMIKLLIDTYAYPLNNGRAFAIDENTAFVVTVNPANGQNSSSGYVIGERGVLVLDLTRAATGKKDDSEVIYPVYGVRASRLSTGDTWNFGTNTLTPAAYKYALAEDYKPVYNSNDVFNGDTFEFDLMTTSLFNAKETKTYGVTKESHPQFTMEIGKLWSESYEQKEWTDRAQAYAGIDPETGVYQEAYGNMWINLHSEST